jgi:hypothetical protein
MILKVRPDLQKSASLLKMAEITLERLRKTEIMDYPSNSLLDYYDAIHKFMEALTLKEGTKIKGEGAHQELIDFVSYKHNLGDQTRLFLQQMRDYRNRISYEGFNVKQNYLQLNTEKIEEIITTLIDVLNN